VYARRPRTVGTKKLFTSVRRKSTPNFKVVIAGRVRERVLNLVSIVNAKLRQINRQPDCRAARRGVKSGQPKSEISIEGIASEEGSEAVVVES
jgi:hypothetical protein